MKLLLDTDVRPDVALGRDKLLEDSALVLAWAEGQAGQAEAAWHSQANLAYLVRPDARDFTRDLPRFTEVAPTGTGSAVRAIGFPMSDFEDALRAAPVPAISPGPLLRKLGSGG